MCRANTSVMTARMADIFRFAMERRLPAIVDGSNRHLDPHQQPLLVYRANYGDLMSQSAAYVNKILWQGARPGELPINRPLVPGASARNSYFSKKFSRRR